MQHKIHSHLVLSLLLIIGLSSCATGKRRYAMHQDRAPGHAVNVDHITDAVPRIEPLSKYGNPESYVVFGQRYNVMKSAQGFRQRGIASWYGSKFHGHRTSNGETYNMYAMTAAHKNLPLPCYVQVTNLENNRSVIVRVNDRGPFHENRIIDLSYVAAKKLGITPTGTAKVEIKVIDPRQEQQKKRRVALTDSFRKKGVTTKAATTETPATDQPVIAEKPPENTPPGASGETQRVFLQVGAFTERSNADELAMQLISLLGKGEINTGYNVEQKIYRVRIGPLADAEEAGKLAEKISAAGLATPKVVLD
ncbi:MAG: septal ring lytic transglycosylase RlpA family protein [Gammaproteobacteria bacterium]|nr:septal ring lytic transglycosylase RlpA family protein [Gammaproteobacteria bacterium]MDH5652431.1 septal ring lytic transglycosylase RlpA family protein [Gammaproteobacteria bacterium]